MPNGERELGDSTSDVPETGEGAESPLKDMLKNGERRIADVELQVNSLLREVERLPDDEVELICNALRTVHMTAFNDRCQRGRAGLRQSVKSALMQLSREPL